jgi:hypothetical protein
MQTAQSMAIGSIWDDVVDWVDKAIHTIANVVNSAAHLAKELAKSIKKAVGKLVADIVTIVSKIGASLANVIVQIAAAFEKILNVIISIAELVWDFIKALFDMNAAWDIGHELKQLFHDQFSSSTTLKANAYSMFQSQTATIQNKMDGIAHDAQKQIDHAIDTALGYDLKNDPSAKAYEQTKDNQKNSTKYHYLNDQVERLSALQSSSSLSSKEVFRASSSTECNSSDTVEELIACVTSKMSQTLLSDLDATINKSMDSITALAKEKTWNETKGSLDTTLKDSAKLVIDEMDILLKGVVQLPLAFFNGSTLIDILDKVLNDVLKPVFELLGILLFQDKDKFKSLGDVGFFAIGFFINMIGVFLKDILSATDEHLNIPGYIKSGKYRSQINALGETTDTQDATLRATPSLIPVSYEIDRVVRTSYSRGCPQGELGKIWNMISPVVLSTSRIPRFIYHYKNDPSPSIGLAADYLFVGSQLVNVERLYQESFTEEEWKDLTSFYVNSTMACRILDLIEAAQKSKTTSENINLTEKSISLLQATITYMIEGAIIQGEEPCMLGKVNLFLSIVGISLASSNVIVDD